MIEQVNVDCAANVNYTCIGIVHINVDVEVQVVVARSIIGNVCDDFPCNVTFAHNCTVNVNIGVTVNVYFTCNVNFHVAVIPVCI